MAKMRTKMKRETVFLTISVILSFSVFFATTAMLGSLADSITDALNPNAAGAAQPIGFNLEGFKNLGLGR